MYTLTLALEVNAGGYGGLPPTVQGLFTGQFITDTVSTAVKLFKVQKFKCHASPCIGNNLMLLAAQQSSICEYVMLNIKFM